MTRALTGHKPLPRPGHCDAPLRSSEARCAGGGKLDQSVFDGVKACCSGLVELRRRRRRIRLGLALLGLS